MISWAIRQESAAENRNVEGKRRTARIARITAQMDHQALLSVAEMQWPSRQQTPEKILFTVAKLGFQSRTRGKSRHKENEAVDLIGIVACTCRVVASRHSSSRFSSFQLH
jgi:hypothetical protein